MDRASLPSNFSRLTSRALPRRFPFTYHRVPLKAWHVINSEDSPAKPLGRLEQADVPTDDSLGVHRQPPRRVRTSNAAAYYDHLAVRGRLRVAPVRRGSASCDREEGHGGGRNSHGRHPAIKAIARHGSQEHEVGLSEAQADDRGGPWGNVATVG